MIDSFKKNANVIITIAVVLVAFIFLYVNKVSINIAGNNLSGAAASFDIDECNLAILSEPSPSGIVMADPLNFRVGPGLNYQIITTLDYCTPLSLLGRTDDSSWILVQAPGNVEGWVYSFYVRTNNEISDLEVKTGFGGPINTSTGAPKVSVVIQEGQAAAFITGMSTNTDVSAVLGPNANASNSILVSSGKTDNQGSATLTFYMPNTWSDGSVVENGTMTLTVTAGSDTVIATLTYFWN